MPGQQKIPLPWRNKVVGARPLLQQIHVDKQAVNGSGCYIQPHPGKTGVQLDALGMIIGHLKQIR